MSSVEQGLELLDKRHFQRLALCLQMIAGTLILGEMAQNRRAEICLILGNNSGMYNAAKTSLSVWSLGLDVSMIRHAVAEE